MPARRSLEIFQQNFAQLHRLSYFFALWLWCTFFCDSTKFSPKLCLVTRFYFFALWWRYTFSCVIVQNMSAKLPLVAQTLLFCTLLMMDIWLCQCSKYVLDIATELCLVTQTLFLEQFSAWAHFLHWCNKSSVFNNCWTWTLALMMADLWLT